MENSMINKYLRNLYINYLVDHQRFVWPSYTYKCLGTMEGFLVALDVIIAGQPFQYIYVEKKIMVLWLLPIYYGRSETYKEHILRLTFETISKD